MHGRIEADSLAPEDMAFAHLGALFTDEAMELKAELHRETLARLNSGLPASSIAPAGDLSARAAKALDSVLRERSHTFPDAISIGMLRDALMDELAGLGPIAPLVASPEVTEVMVNGPGRVFVEMGGVIRETPARFLSERHLMQVIQRIVEPLGRHVDDASPMVDARLPDGSRVNAVIPPLALDGASLTVRKFGERRLDCEDLISYGSMSRDMAEFLKEAVRTRRNILVSGGTGSGKTTLLNVLSRFIPHRERIVTVEDSAELKLTHRNVVRLEARPANIEGKGRISIRELVINCLRMRPDRIIVGECRGAEALDMLQAMNTGHDGSLTTAHANNPRDALSRLENMVMMAGFDLPSAAIREQISSAIDLIVHEMRFSDGSRRVVDIVEITGIDAGVIQMQEIFRFRQTGLDKNGRTEGHFAATGNIPRFMEELKRRGALRLSLDVFSR